MQLNLQKLVKGLDLQKLANVYLNNLVEAVALLVVCASGLCQKEVAMNKAGAKLAALVALALTLADLYSPEMGRSLRQGAGFGVGAMLVGFP